MEIILLQDVKNLGYKNDIVKVKNGFGNNFLIPQGLGILATESHRKVLAENLKQQAFKSEKLRKEAESLKEKISLITLKIAAKTSSTGKIFGSVNNIQIAEALKEQHNIDIDRKKIEFEAVKDLGTYTANISLFKEISAECKFEVIAE